VTVSGDGAIHISVSGKLHPLMKLRLEFPQVVPTRRALPTAKDYQIVLHFNHAMLGPGCRFQISKTKPDLYPY
jgi:hypothetical protein